jgi:sigma-E factor negative regulatory protein RseA
MTEQISDQISAFIDDELSDEESAFLLRRFERDADARNRAARYTMIGAALRDELSPDHSILRRRIAVALTGTVPSTQQRPAARLQWRYFRPAVGVGIAATVAVAAIVGLRAVNVAHVGAPGVPATVNAPLQTRATEPVPSYVVPPEASDTPVVPVASMATGTVRLTNYVMHHSEYASRLNRQSVHANVVGAAELMPLAETAPAKREPKGE